MRYGEGSKEYAISRENEAEAIKVPEDVRERLAAIARLVGGDWDVKVEIGQPGSGSFFDESQNRISFDPLHLIDPAREAQAEFVAAHEGGHRAITRGPERIGLAREKARELYGKLGFAFGANSLEDPADNDWWSKKYEGLEPSVKTTYDEMFREDGAVLGSPDVHAQIAVLGHTPRYAHFGSELIRLWHTGETSKNIPEEVKEALGRVRQAAMDYFEEIPGEYPKDREAVDFARRRFQIYLEKIWPEMERLTREDLADERLAQMVKEKGASKLPNELRDELEKAMGETAEAAARAEKASAEKEAVELERDAKALREAGLEKQAADLESQANERREAGKNKAEALRQGEDGRPVPLEKLSPELRAELEKMFRELSAEERRALEKAAREALEKLEDGLNKGLSSKLDPNRPENHEEQRKSETKAEQSIQEARQVKEDAARAKAEISRAREAERTEYDRAYADIAPFVDRLSDDIDRLFLPKRHPRWRGHFPVGGRLDLRKAMQFEARPETYTELWERKTIPHKKDFAFTLLVDLSGSMAGDKIDKTFRGAILVAEALTRSGIDVEILGFQDEIIEFKPAGEKMNDVARSRMSGMPAEVSATNPTGHNQPNWNDDGYALDRSAERLRERPAKEKFLVVLSDGQPAPSPAHNGARWEIKKVIQELRDKKDIRMLGVGLGPGTEHVRDYYPNSVVVPDVSELPHELAALFEDIISNPETY